MAMLTGTLIFTFTANYTGVASQTDDTSLNIVTTNTIMADVVQNVAGDSNFVVSLMAIGEDPHSFNLSGRDIVTLEDADVVFINGANLEEGLLDVLQETSADKLVTISACVDILPVGDLDIDHDHSDDDHVEHHDEVDCDAHHTELDGLTGESISEHKGLGYLVDVDCKVETCDPHVWFDVQNVMLWTIQVRDTLIYLDPSHAVIYKENAANYLAELLALDTEISFIFGQFPANERILVTNHAVLSYLAQRYDFEIIGTIIPSASTSAEPSTGDVIDVITIIEDTGVPAIFVDSSANSVVAAQIATETGAKVQVLYTETLSSADKSAATYLDYMRYNMAQIVEGLTQ